MQSHVACRTGNVKAPGGETVSRVAERGFTGPAGAATELMTRASAADDGGEYTEICGNAGPRGNATFTGVVPYVGANHNDAVTHIEVRRG